MIDKRGSRRLTGKMEGKLRFVIIGILVLFLILIGRLAYWTIQKGEKYSTIVLGQQNHSSTVIPSERGEILDRNGNILATNERIYTLILEPKNILANDGQYKDATIQAIYDYLGYNKNAVLKEVEDNADSYYLIYGPKLSYDQVSEFQDFLNLTERSTDTMTEEELNLREEAAKVKGVYFEESYKRIYPYKSLACRLLGFSTNNSGSWGIEQYYNDTLTGTNGRAYYNFTDELVQQKTIVDAENGNTVVSTIDMKIQDIIENAINTFDNGVGSKETSILVMNPQNGEILGMASSYPYDLNDPDNTDNLNGLFTEEEIRQMQDYTNQLEKEAAEEEQAKNAKETTEEEDVIEDDEEDSSEATTEEATTEEKDDEDDEDKKTIYDGLYQLWRNPVISDTYEPGSVFKPFTVCAGLESGVLSGNETFNCFGSKKVDGVSIGCSHEHGTISLKEAIAESCNVAMMNIAFNETADVFYAYQSMFGFGKKTKIDLPGETGASSLVKNADNYQYDVTLATNSFGQNFNCTMIQMAAAFASLINGGCYYKPHVVKEIQNDNGDVIEKEDKELVKYTISQSTCNKIKSYLKETVKSGTGTRAQISGYSIGGKTGTAEKVNRDKEHYYVSFMGFTSVDDPQLMIYVTIDEPNVKNQDNAALAVLLEREVMDQIIDYMGIEPDNDSTALDDGYIDEYDKAFNKAFFGSKKGKSY